MPETVVTFGLVVSVDVTEARTSLKPWMSSMTNSYGAVAVFATRL